MTSPPVGAAPAFIESRGAGLAWIALLIAAYLVLGLAVSIQRTEPDTYDANQFLAIAMEIRHEGGALVLLRDHLTGRYLLSNQHPLYPTILSLVAANDPSFWPRAKLVTLFTSIAAILAVFCAVRALFGPGEAMIASVIIAFSMRWIDHAAQVTVDPLLACFTTLSWWWSIESLRGERGRTFAAGAAVGIAYLVKANGLFMIPAWLGSLVARQGWRAILSRRTAVYLGAFFLLTAFLLWRNVIIYGSPFYNDNSNYLWVSHWTDLWSPAFNADPVTFHGYLAAQGLGGMMERWIGGLAAVLVWLIECQRPFFINGSWFPIAGGLFVFAALWQALRDDDPARRIVSVTYLLINWAFFSWWVHIYFEARFVFPMLAPIAGYGAHAVMRLVNRFLAPETSRRAVAVSLGALCLVVTLALAPVVISSSDQLTGDDVHETSASEAVWMNETLPPEKRYYGRLSPTVAARRVREAERSTSP